VAQNHGEIVNRGRWHAPERHATLDGGNRGGESIMAGRIEGRLAQLGITLPEAATPQANYIPYTVSGNLVFISGQIANAPTGVITGKLGQELDVPRGREAARACGLNILAHLRAACGGDLDRVVRCLKVGGFVNGTSTFTEPPQVINGCSDLFVEVFGDAGRHARFAIAVSCLPRNSAVEVDAIFEIAPAGSARASRAAPARAKKAAPKKKTVKKKTAKRRGR
jgi:enamine deaminase RidA (YjgF/YER057c/UK114 family)